MGLTPEILFFDTENAPNIAATWGIHDQRINYQDVVKEWFFISVQWAWNDSKKINSVSILDDKKRFKKDPTDDFLVVKTAYDIIQEAEIIVGHNIVRHDLKKLQAKVLEHGMKPLRIPEIVDTYDWSKKFGFTSKKLGDLCTKLGLQEKLTHEPGLFLKAALGNVEAIEKIVKYGRGDIPTVRDLYHRLKPHAHKHPNHNLWRGDGIECCPRCGSNKFHASGFKVNVTGKYQRFKCQDCGHWFQSGKAIKRVRMK